MVMFKVGHVMAIVESLVGFFPHLMYGKEMKVKTKRMTPYSQFISDLCSGSSRKSCFLNSRILPTKQSKFVSYILA